MSRLYPTCDTWLVWARLVLAVIAVAGCDQVFRLDQIDPIETTTVSGRYVIRRAVSQPDTSIVVADESFRPSAVTAFLKTNDGSLPVDFGDDGSFAFTSDGGRYRLVVVGSRSFPIEIQHDAANLDLTLRVWGRDGRTAVTTPTDVSYVPIPPPGSGCC